MLNAFGARGYKVILQLLLLGTGVDDSYLQSEFAVPPGFHGQDVAYIFTS